MSRSITRYPAQRRGYWLSAFYHNDKPLHALYHDYNYDFELGASETGPGLEFIFAYLK
jgi:hypothetical protein